jgi:proteasome lid subunit RPN8/RPN11
MIRSLVISNKLREKIDAEARAAIPRECCGLVIGSDEAGSICVLEVQPTRNLAKEPDRFEIDPAAHFALLRRLRETSHRIVGCYHSHPGGAAEPSGHDFSSASDIGFVWVIAAVAEQKFDLRAWVRDAGQFRELALLDRSTARTL